MKAALLFLFLLSGCASMHFDIEAAPEDYDYGEWHHILLNGLVTVSPVVDLKDRCQGRGAASIRIDGTFPQLVSYLATLKFYDPWRVSYACK